MIRPGRQLTRAAITFSPPTSNVIAWQLARTYHERMATLPVREKLAILSDAAKYDASCASSGAAKKDSLKSGGMGSEQGAPVETGKE